VKHIIRKKLKEHQKTMCLIEDFKARGGKITHCEPDPIFNLTFDWEIEEELNNRNTELKQFLWEMKQKYAKVLHDEATSVNKRD
jgi:hypothetical protein